MADRTPYSPVREADPPVKEAIPPFYAAQADKEKANDKANDKDRDRDKTDFKNADPRTEKELVVVQEGGVGAEVGRADSYISGHSSKEIFYCVKEGEKEEEEEEEEEREGGDDPNQTDPHDTTPSIKKRWNIAPQPHLDPDRINRPNTTAPSPTSDSKSEAKHRQRSKGPTSTSTAEEEGKAVPTPTQKLWSIILPGTLTNEKGDNSATNCRKVLKQGRKTLQAFHSTKSLTANELTTRARELHALREAVDPSTLELEEPCLAVQTIYATMDQADRCLTRYIDGLRQGDVERLTEKCQQDVKYRKSMEEWLLDIDVPVLLKKSEKENAKGLEERQAVMAKAWKRKRQGTEGHGYYRTSGWGTDEKMAIILKRVLKNSRNKLEIWTKGAAGKPSQLLRKSRSRFFA